MKVTKEGERHPKEIEMSQDEILIIAQKRTVTGKKVGALRREGLLPGVIYGRHLEALPIQMETKEASYKINRLTASSLVVIDVEGEKHTAIVRDRQKDVIFGDLLHVDFLAVSLTETLRTTVNIELVGEAPVSKSGDYVIVQSLNILEIECLPNDLPERIEVDLSVLETIDDNIFVKSLKLDENITILTDPEELIVSVTYVKEEAEQEVQGEEEPEVLEKGKIEEEEGEAE